MTKEQRERVENALISMIENAPAMNFMPDNPHKSVSSEYMKAAAEVTYALIALQESATPVSPNARVVSTVGGKLSPVEATPLRGITVKMPNGEDEG